jgi:signal transduction histidine kinase/CheY-like chemotaxis protein
MRSNRKPNLLDGLQSDPAVSLGPMIALLVLVGFAFLFLGDGQANELRRISFLLLAMLSFIGVGIAALLGHWQPMLARCIIVVVLALIPALSYRQLGGPGLVTLIMIPTTLAALSIGLVAGVGASLAATALLFWLALAPSGGLEPGGLVIALIVIWTTWAAVYAFHRRTSQREGWVWEHYQWAEQMLAEAQELRASSLRTVDDLAHANRQLALASDRMAALRTVAEEAEKSKSLFVARVSHEFRTPLNMIIGLVSLMVDTPEIYDVVVPPEMRDDLEVVYRNSQHLADMINDVLSLTQAEAGRLAMHRKLVDLRQLVESATTCVSPLVEKKRLVLTVSIVDNLPLIYCDATRIQQVLLNLLSNAARFVSQGTIAVHVERRGENVRVSVSDTGPGILPEDQKRLFEPFGQGSTELWRATGGSGLGLSISKQFVEMHGGRIWVESEVGTGSRFCFEIPISPEAKQILRSSSPIIEEWSWRRRELRTEQARRAELPNLPRLLIYDEADSLSPWLESYTGQVECVTISDLDAVAECVQEVGADALVVNAESPRSLWTILEHLDGAQSDLPIIGCALPKPAGKAFEPGIVGYLTKPVTSARFAEAIRKIGRPVRRVLVVDDDPDVLRLFTRSLHVYDSRLSVITASTGQGALEALNAEPVDLVLLDVVMPGLDGWQVANSLQQNAGFRDTPVIMVSANDPMDTVPTSPLLVLAAPKGLQVSQVLRCSVALADLLLASGAGPNPAPQQSASARPASRGTESRRAPAPGSLP